MAEHEQVSDAEFALAIEAMRAAGRKAGTAAGSWVIDGNTSEATARAVLEQIANCELDKPAPFSGEWSGEPTIDDVINSETELDSESLTPEERDDLASAFEDEFYVAYESEAERSALAILPE